MRERGAFLTIAAVLFGLLGVSNLLKPLQIGGAETGFVFFGQRLAGTANTIIGPLFGVALLAYAVGIWGMRRWALPLGWAYAGYVLVNLFLFTARNPGAFAAGRRVFGIVYTAVALGISWGAALVLRRRADELT
jgi:hypothetical protein